MNYLVIYEDLNKIKSILNKLFETKNISKILDKIEESSFKRVIKIQYMYLYQKKYNLLDSNKSIRIINLEKYLYTIKDKKPDYIYIILNKLGYIDILLILLNIDKAVFEELKTFLIKKKNIKLVASDVNMENIMNEPTIDNDTVNILVDKISKNLYDTIASLLDKATESKTFKNEDIGNKNENSKSNNINIEFNQSVQVKKIKPRNDEDLDNQDNQQENQQENQLSDDESNNDVDDNLVENKMKIIGNNLLEEYEVSTEKENEVKKVKLNKNDIDLLNMLEN